MFTSILCPVDFSEHSDRALCRAIALAGLTGAHLTILTVNDPILDAAAHAAGTAHTVNAQTQKELRALFARLVAGGPSVPMGVAVVVGKAADEILKQAAECGADLIVMATHGHTGPARFLLGSVTERVLRHSKIPVLAVPPAHR